MSKTKKGLGRGFESLLPTTLFDDSFDPTKNEDAKSSKLMEIELIKITADGDQPRKKFDEEALMSLAESIKQHGVLQPIVLVKQANKYKIIAGERRFRASQIAGLTKIPAIIRTLNAQNQLEVSLIENVQRQDLNIIEIATGYLKLREQFNMSLDEISQRVSGKTKGAISNTMRLLRLPANVIKLLSDGELTEGQARPLVGLDEKIINDLVLKIIEQNWSARRVERVVANYRKQADKTQISTKDIKLKTVLRADKQSSKLSKKLATKVQVKAKKNGTGVIEIAFKNQDEFDRITDSLI